MKKDLVVNMITAHISGVENNFKTAVFALAEDEEKKGNLSVAESLRGAYGGRGGGSTLIRKLDVPPKLNGNGSLLAAQSVSANPIAPRDKDSMLELFEIISPVERLEDVVLPPNQTKLLRQILSENESADKLAAHNLPPANRLLLCGPPGCGKTMTARALANELGLPLAYVRLDGLVSSYLGQTSVNLRKVFDSVRNMQVVLFLDEFDAIAKKRDDGNELGELKRVVTALLQNFDNMPPNVFLIAATNHEHLLDPAIWRRFNYTVTLSYPDDGQRAELIGRWLKEFGIDHKINIKKLTTLTTERSTAQLKELIMSVGKRYVTKGDVITLDDVLELFVQQLTNNANPTGVLDVLIDLHQKGASVRKLAEVVGVPHNSLQYRINNLERKEIVENGE